MAATLWSAINLNFLNILVFLIFINSFILPCLSQLISPQNIQTFYPFILPPLQPPLIPTRPPAQPPPPETPLPPPPLFLSPPPSTPSRKAVGTAIGVTAASTIVLSALFFFFLLRYFRSKREKGGAAVGGGENRAAGGGQDEFVRFEGNLKGVIVDEDGLDVLYWRKLEGGEGKESFNRQIFSNIESGGGGKRDLREDEKRMIAARGGGRKKPGRPVQEIPLLRGKSSTSQEPIWAESENPGAPPPPPPPLSVQAIPNAPLPPLPESGGLASSSSEQGVPGNGEEQGNLDANVEGDSYKFDGDLMEALFGTVATNRKSPRTDSSSASTTPREIPGQKSQIFILETRKSHEIATVIKSLEVTRKEIMNALDNGIGLDSETLQKLTRIAPTKTEETEILSFVGSPTMLADGDSFLFYILKSHKSAFDRFYAMFLRSNYDSEILQLRASLQTLESACNELRNNRLFIKLLEAILKAGDRMSSRIHGGNGKGFNLRALRKLSDVKSVDGKITVIQFVVQEIVRAEGKKCSARNPSRDNDKEKEYMTLGLPIVGGLSSEFSILMKASAIDSNALSHALPILSSKTSEISNIIAQSEGNNGKGFATEMARFLGVAEEEMKFLREEQNRVMEMVQRTTEYFQSGASNDKSWQPFQLFDLVKDFLGMIDQYCIEISRNLQKKKSSSSSDGSSTSSRTVKFPKLSADFLSEQTEKTSDS